MNRIVYALPLMTIILIVATCCKDKTPSTPSTGSCTQNPGSCNSVLAAKQFFCFKIGTWWVYEEETSHLRDSMYVYEYTNDADGFDFYVGYESALTGYRYRQWPTWSQWSPGCSNLNAPVNNICLFVTRDKGKFQDFVGESNVFMVQYNVGSSLSSFNNSYANNRIEVKEVKDSFELGTYNFGETVKILDPHAVQEHNNPTNYYYSKGVGLVRKELLDSNEVWNLVNYHIAP